MQYGLMPACGPTRTTWAVQQVGGHLRCSGRDADVVVTAALDPKATFGRVSSCKHQTYNFTTVGTRGSSLRQPRLAQPVKTVLGILGVLVDHNTFPAFNRETGVDP